MSELNLRKIAEDFKEKLTPIKIALFDCDGILTDGRVYYQGEEVGFNRFFFVQDGYGLKMLMNAGIKVGVISGGSSTGLYNRMDQLGIHYKCFGNEDKREAYLDILKRENAEDREILYMGDEFFDLPLLKRAGFAATVKHASHEIQETVDYVCHRDAGKGAAREVIDLMRYAQGWSPNVPDFE
ncbi:MAG: HAD hydrolase family protein [Halobacteriovoraceae bacterium]|nr:HAD hydrolase family protein [Halobacteriovoraceae bacterium]